MPLTDRKINKVSFKVLDAPNLQDDFYLNLIDWSAGNVLAVALSNSVYLWNAASSRVNKLCEVPSQDMVTSVIWSPNSTTLSVGTNGGTIQLWDVTKNKIVRTLAGHTARVGSMAWNNNYILSSGSKDKIILNRDTRDPNKFTEQLIGHKQEVCGLKWSFNGQQLASGGNDNKIMLWNMNSNVPQTTLNRHTAAVKALAWSPHQYGLLASGGGTADKTIRFWNTISGEQVNCYDVGSQVCNVLFSKTVNELVSTHGYSLNEINLWKYPKM